MINEILFRLGAREVLLADGALGTQLLERGLPTGDCPESCNLSSPHLLTQIAREYFAAGAMIVTTNTFGASPLKLLGYGLADKTEEINRRGVMAVREAVTGQAYVAGSVGPTGHTLQPYGAADPDDVYRGYLRQIKVLADAGVDLILVETMTDLTEATLAVRAARAAARKIPIAATMTFDRTRRGFFTIMGVDIPTAVNALSKAGASIVGSNCGLGSEAMVEVTREFRRSTTLPLLVQPNAGLPQLVGDRAVYPETPETMAANVAKMITAGAAIVGGCCGTSPAHIHSMREIVNRAMDSR